MILHRYGEGIEIGAREPTRTYRNTERIRAGSPGGQLRISEKSEESHRVYGSGFTKRRGTTVKHVLKEEGICFSDQRGTTLLSNVGDGPAVLIKQPILRDRFEIKRVDVTPT